jgi:proton glutamate symport protein
MTLLQLQRSLNQPAVTLGAVVVALALGATQHPLLQYLRPIGGFYLAILQICVLPFLLTTIPLAVRAAMTQGIAGNVARRLVAGLALALVASCVIGVAVPATIFHLLAIDERTIAAIGALVNTSTDRIDLQFALDPARAPAAVAPVESGLLAMVPTNIFAALSGNDSVRVVIFAAVFGIGMAVSERRSGNSVFCAMRHIQEVCILIFDWFNLLVPIGIVALIAPQVALLGADIFAVLALFFYAFLAASLLILAGTIVLLAVALRVGAWTACAGMLGPMMLGAATRNTLVCIPLSIETMTETFHVPREPCELYIPVGFATIRFGTILYFTVATLFMGALLGRGFGLGEVVLVATLSVAASFATLGVTGLNALAPLAIVLRPFGLSYELAVPLMVIVDPIANMIRVMLNVALNCLIPAFAAGRIASTRKASYVPAEDVLRIAAE